MYHIAKWWSHRNFVETGVFSMAARERRAKVWELQTQLYDTYGNPYINIPNMKAVLDQYHASGDITDYAYCVHNRDKYTQEDEDKANAEIARGVQRKALKAGEAKPEHIHIEIRLKEAKSLTALAKFLGVPEQWVVYVRENKDGEPETFDDKCVYLCHEREPDKTPYDYSEIVCTFDYAAMMAKYALRLKRKKKSKQSKAFRDEHINKIAAGEESVKDFIREFGYATYEDNKRRYDNAETHYMRTAYQGVGVRMTMLITGPSTVGKSPLAQVYACSLFPDIKNPREVFFSTGDNGATLQGYQGQPVIIWDDYRAVDFIQTFGRKVLFNSLFSLHPSPTDFNIKYGSVVLRHTFNIVTCIDDIDTFARELAGEYTDKMGNFHKGEEKQVLQVYKRIWGLSEVTEEEIRLMFNMGYCNPNSAQAYRQFETLAVMQNNMRALVEKYSPQLYSHIGRQMAPELASKYEEQMEKEKAKISDISQFDPADLPRRFSPDDLAEAAYAEAERRGQEEAEAELEQLDLLQQEHEAVAVARAEYEARRAAGEPVELVGDAVCSPQDYHMIDWIYVDSSEERARRFAEQQTELQRWTAAQAAKPPEQRLYDPTTDPMRQY